MRLDTAPLARAYTRLFHLQEIAQDAVLRWFGGAVLLGFLVTFNVWQMNPATTLSAVQGGRVVCWPFFKNCADWIWMETLPQGYSQMVFFMVLFALILRAALALIRNQVIAAHGCILLLLLAKLYLTLQNFFYNANYDYYHTSFAFIFLFLGHKRFFTSLSIVLFYFLSTAAKIHPSWTMGMYFTALADGLPIFPAGSEPFFTNLVIFMEMVGAWFLFSHRPRIQKAVFWFFCFFHLYSGVLVGYRYPITVMPALLILFGPYFKPFDAAPLDKKSMLGWLMVAALCVVQSIPLLIKGDAKLTLEGNFYGLYMFEANHQCEVKLSDAQGQVLSRIVSTNARNRCDPWPSLSMAQQKHCKGPPQKLRMQLIHSINGGPFYEVVNEPDLCALTYSAFSHNPWIKDHTEAKMLGRPVKNYYF